MHESLTVVWASDYIPFFKPGSVQASMTSVFWASLVVLSISGEANTDPW